jgi:hypothetical protein
MFALFGVYLPIMNAPGGVSSLVALCEPNVTEPAPALSFSMTAPMPRFHTWIGVRNPTLLSVLLDRLDVAASLGADALPPSLGETAAASVVGGAALACSLVDGIALPGGGAPAQLELVCVVSSAPTSTAALSQAINGYMTGGMVDLSLSMRLELRVFGVVPLGFSGARSLHLNASQPPPPSANATAAPPPPPAPSAPPAAPELCGDGGADSSALDAFLPALSMGHSASAASMVSEMVWLGSLGLCDLQPDYAGPPPPSLSSCADAGGGQNMSCDCAGTAAGSPMLGLLALSGLPVAASMPLCAQRVEQAARGAFGYTLVELDLGARNPTPLTVRVAALELSVGLAAAAAGSDLVACTLAEAPLELPPTSLRVLPLLCALSSGLPATVAAYRANQTLELALEASVDASAFGITVQRALGTTANLSRAAVHEALGDGPHATVPPELAAAYPAGPLAQLRALAPLLCGDGCANQTLEAVREVLELARLV